MTRESSGLASLGSVGNLQTPSIILFCSNFPSKLLNQLLLVAMVWSNQHEILFETFFLNSYFMKFNVIGRVLN